MRPPLSSRSSTKPRGSKIRAWPHSDLAEFLFWWRNCFWGEKIEKSLSDFSNFLRWNSLRFGREVILISFPCFHFFRKICKTRFSLSQKYTKMLKTKNCPDNPYFFDFKSFLLPDYTRFEHITKFYRRKLKKIEIKAKKKKKNGDIWVVLFWDLKPWYQTWLLNSKFWPLFVMFQ